MAKEIYRRPIKRFFRNAFKTLLPWWLAEGEGEPHQWTLGVFMDRLLDKMYQTVYARYPTYAPDDAYRYMARDRKIVRGANEPVDVFAERLLRWLEDHSTRGNPWALMEQLRAYMFPAQTRIRTVDERGNWYTIDRDGTRGYLLGTDGWNWDATVGPEWWARFWVIIYPEETPIGSGRFIPWSDSPVWGAGTGRIWGSRNLTWGTTATSSEVATVRQIVRTWKPAGTTCVNIIIAYDDNSFDPTAPEPDGDWQNHGTSGSGPRVANRLSTARYWAGTGAL
jgi:hypothetical protein